MRRTYGISGLEDRIADFAANCIHICELLPRGKAGSSNFKDQLARSATSVAANYAEASVPSSQRDFVGRLTIALKELAESRMHLSIIARLKYKKTLARSIIMPLVNEADAIAEILRSGLKSKRVNRATEEIGDAAPEPKPAPYKKLSIAKLLKSTDAKPRKSPGRKKKATRKRAATKRKTTARKTTARKTTARKTTARKTTARKTTARKTTARKTTARKTTARRTKHEAPITPIIVTSQRLLTCPPSPLRIALAPPPPLLPLY